LTTTLLGFAKPMAQEMAPNDFNEIVRSTISLLSEEAKTNEITLTTALDDNLPPVTCDLNQIKQILINLIINGFDAIGSRGEICVSTGMQQDNIFLAVEDNGPGVSPDKAGYVFNPFYTTKTRGTGLGLAISKKIAREHQGDLVLESDEGLGCKFTLILQGG